MNSTTKEKVMERIVNRPPSMNVEKVLSQLSSIADNSRSFISGKAEDAENNEVWENDIKACEEATAIISALQDEGINDSEQVKDLIADYRALAVQCRKMTQKYETPTEVIMANSQYYCPGCRKPLLHHPNHCPECGKRIDYDIKARKKRR